MGTHVWNRHWGVVSPSAVQLGKLGRVIWVWGNCTTNKKGGKKRGSVVQEGNPPNRPANQEEGGGKGNAAVE